MRGKKTDSEFISEFISQSIQQGMDTPELIVQNAKNMISSIDEQIKKIEEQKVVRSKLLDVINNFEKNNKQTKVEEAKVLSFFKIQNPHICKYICNRLKKTGLTINEIYHTDFSELDMVFCIKQLIEFKVITRMGDSLLRGEKFDEYLKFVLKEV